jgi:hypothetical protein
LARYWGNLLVKERAAYLSKSLGPFFLLLGDLFARGILILQKGIWDITQMVLLLGV